MPRGQFVVLALGAVSSLTPTHSNQFGFDPLSSQCERFRDQKASYTIPWPSRTRRLVVLQAHVSPESDRSLQTIVLYPPLFENLLAIRYLREWTLRYAHL